MAAFANVRRAVRPGGRLALVTWRGLADNEWIVAFSAAMAGGRERPTPPADAPGPFALADPGRVRTVLSDAGFLRGSLLTSFREIISVVGCIRVRMQRRRVFGPDRNGGVVQVKYTNQYVPGPYPVRGRENV